MRGRNRIAAIGVASLAIVAALSSSAGATSSPATWTVKANGGFVGLGLLNTVAVSGGGSEADASSGNLSEAIGTGVCLTSSATSNPCPSSPTDSTSGLMLDTSQSAIAKSVGQSVSPGSANCAVPAINVSVLTLGPACGSASASEDANGNPTATGSGSLANASLSLNLGSLNLAAPASLCTGIAAATPTAGSGSGALPTQVTSILTTVNGLIGTIVPNGVPLSTTSVDTSSPTAGVCSVVNGLLSELGSTPVGSLLSTLTSTTNLASVPLASVTVGGSTSKVTSSGSTLTATATQEAADINVLGMLDVQVTPTVASVSVNEQTGQVTPSCNAGVVSVTADGSALPLSELNQLGTVIQTVLTDLNATPLGSVIGELLNFQPDGILSCTPATTNGGTSGSAVADSLDLNLLPTPGVLALDLGNVSASASTTAATTSSNAVPASNPAPTPAAATPAATPGPAAVVPNVTTVHTGEYWAGTLPIILMAGMGLAGILLIGRRRIFSVARSINPITRRRSSH